jgi:hypothetical protein
MAFISIILFPIGSFSSLASKKARRAIFLHEETTEANQALEPTAGDVTLTAFALIVPPPAVAHL